MGAQASSGSNNKSAEKLPRPVVDSDVKAIAELVLQLSQDVLTSKKMFNDIETSENIGQKLEELQDQFEQIADDIVHTVKEIKKLQNRIIHAGSTQSQLIEELAVLMKHLSRLNTENQNHMTRTKELQKRAQRLQTVASQESVL